MRQPSSSNPGLDLAREARDPGWLGRHRKIPNRVMPPAKDDVLNATVDELIHEMANGSDVRAPGEDELLAYLPTQPLSSFEVGSVARDYDLRCAGHSPAQRDSFALPSAVRASSVIAPAMPRQPTSVPTVFDRPQSFSPQQVERAPRQSRSVLKTLCELEGAPVDVTLQTRCVAPPTLRGMWAVVGALCLTTLLCEGLLRIAMLFNEPAIAAVMACAPGMVFLLLAPLLSRVRGRLARGLAILLVPLALLALAWVLRFGLVIELHSLAHIDVGVLRQHAFFAWSTSAFAESYMALFAGEAILFGALVMGGCRR
jgi:hypothetical protein